MFNFVMGIVMIGIGAISVAHAFFSKNMAGFIFFGILMIGFGIVERKGQKEGCQRQRV